MSLAIVSGVTIIFFGLTDKMARVRAQASKLAAFLNGNEWSDPVHARVTDRFVSLTYTADGDLDFETFDRLLRQCEAVVRTEFASDDVFIAMDYVDGDEVDRLIVDAESYKAEKARAGEDIPELEITDFGAIGRSPTKREALERVAEFLPDDLLSEGRHRRQKDVFGNNDVFGKNVTS